MSSPSVRSARLLHADEEQIDRAAIALGSGTAFVVVVCPPELRTLVLVRLRGRVTGLTLPDPVEVGTDWEMLDALVEQVERRDKVLSLTLGGDVVGALDALNLHREKTYKGAPVILWLEDVDALVRLRERAPDAFSFRSTMAVVRGDGGPLPLPKGEEPEDIRRARKRLKRAKTPLERASAGQWMTEMLRVRGRVVEAGSFARTALKELSAADTEEAYSVRINLCMSMAGVARGTGMLAQEVHWKTRALAEATNVSHARGIEHEADIQAKFPGPFSGRDCTSVRKALAMVRTYELGPELAFQALRSAGAVTGELGNIQAARVLFEESVFIARHAVLIDRANCMVEFAALDLLAGDFISSESRCRDAAMAIAADGGSPDPALMNLSRCLLDRGEIDAARAAVDALGSEEDACAYRARGVAAIELERGNMVASLVPLREALRQAEARHADGLHVDLLTHLAWSVEQGTDAERVSQTEIKAALADLTRGETLVLAVAGPDGPAWQRILLLALRARLLALTPDTLPQAFTVARHAFDLAGSTYSDLIPQTGRALADLLLSAHASEDALAVMAGSEPYATQNGFLQERALLLAARILALVQRGDPPHTLDPHLAVLREALAATNSPRITAGTLRDLAKRLPPSATTPDPHALAEEALGLFVSMPMPAQEARCLEIMGDVLLARGLTDEAKRRYLTARGRLERYGLGLRVPLLDRKLGALPPTSHA